MLVVLDFYKQKAILGQWSHISTYPYVVIATHVACIAHYVPTFNNIQPVAETL